MIRGFKRSNLPTRICLDSVDFQGSWNSQVLRQLRMQSAFWLSSSYLLFTDLENVGDRKGGITVFPSSSQAIQLLPVWGPCPRRAAVQLQPWVNARRLGFTERLKKLSSFRRPKRQTMLATWRTGSEIHFISAGRTGESVFKWQGDLL